MENLENNVVENVETQEVAKGQEERMFTQAELDKIIKERLEKESRKIAKSKEKEMNAIIEAERLESERLAKMNEAEREKAKAEKERLKFEQDRLKFEEERKVFEQAKIRTQTMEMLSERSIPVEMAQFITSNNADEIMENVSTFEKVFNESVEKVVTERLRGKTPQASLKKDGLTLADFRKLSMLKQQEMLIANPNLKNELLNNK